MGSVITAIYKDRLGSLLNLCFFLTISIKHSLICIFGPVCPGNNLSNTIITLLVGTGRVVFRCGLG